MSPNRFKRTELSFPFYEDRRAEGEPGGKRCGIQSRPPPDSPPRRFSKSTSPQEGRLGVALMLAFSFANAFCSPALGAPVKILMLGTSLTQGFGLPPGTEIPAVLEAKLKSAGIDTKVINAGISRDTSADGRSRLDWSLAARPKAGSGEIGSTDAPRGIASAQ